MKDMFKFICRFSPGIILILFSLLSCETTELKLQDSPSQLTVPAAEANFVLNGIQLNMARQHVNLSSITNRIVRHTNQFGTYASSARTSTMNFAWARAYSITSNLNLLEDLSTVLNLPNQVGMGQVMEAFAYVNLVDMIGTAVYSEAVNPDEFPSPNLDSGQSIYDAMYVQLDEAIENLSATGSVQPIDIFYNGDMTRWIKLANTLKLKMYVTSKLSSPNPSAINAIVASGNYIKEEADDFQLYYSKQDVNPDGRHPFFTSDYITSAGTYQSNQFMYKLRFEKSIKDPRLPYYFFRQDLRHPLDIGEELGIGDDLLPCVNFNYDYCYIGDGYWGRDHGDDEGIPNDGVYRTAYGIYPGGGAYDTGNNNAPTVEVNSHLRGAGIHPMLTASFVKFMLAEAALPAPAGIGTTGNPRTLLEEGIRASMFKVADFSGVPMESAAVNAYVDVVLADYDAAANDQERLAIIIDEYYIALYGNGLEAYNNYRRTGYPDLQASVIAGTAFPRSFFLPESELNSNDNPDLVQKSLTDQVFWDTNPAGFID